MISYCSEPSGMSVDLSQMLPSIINFIFLFLQLTGLPAIWGGSDFILSSLDLYGTLKYSIKIYWSQEALKSEALS